MRCVGRGASGEVKHIDGGDMVRCMRQYHKKDAHKGDVYEQA